MNTLFLDLETFGIVALRTHGAHRYAQDSEIMLIALGWDDEPIEVWDLTADPVALDGYLDTLQQMIDEADRVVTHGTFDAIILAAHGVTLPPQKHDDVMLHALQHSLPGALEKLCDILNVPVDLAKDADGKKLINLFCSPTPKNWKIRRATRRTHTAEWVRFIEYARSDVIAMREVRKRIPRWNLTPLERELWYLDQKTNRLGMAVDQDHAKAAIKAFEDVKTSAAEQTLALTGGVLASTTQRDKFLTLLQEEYAFTETDVAKGTLERLMRGDIPPKLRALLEVRIKASAASPAKYKALLRAVGSDGRLRDTLQFCGAGRTGRDAGRIFQPQNLPRPSLTQEEVETGIAALQAGCADLLFDVGELCISAVRGAIVAEVGKRLLVADLSNIEGRILAWLAEEDWKLDAFRAFDRGEGPDLYNVTAGRIIGKDPYAVTKDERAKLGKIPELAGGYQGSIGAYRRMGGKVLEAMSDDEILTIVRQWRRNHPKTQAFWYAMEAAARSAVHNRGQAYKCGRITFDTADGPDGQPYLRMRLPSGRYLCYLHPDNGTRLCPSCEGQGVVRVPPDMVYEPCEDCGGIGSWGSGELNYHGVSDTNYQWGRVKTYGGKLTENCVQAVARDIFMHGMRRASNASYPIVLRVHDELVAEVPDGSDHSIDDLIGCMTVNPVWANGLPLAAAGFETFRYYKD